MPTVYVNDKPVEIGAARLNCVQAADRAAQRRLDYFRALALMEGGDVRPARTLLRDLLAQDPKDAQSTALLAQAEERLGREAVQGNRHRPDGIELRWRQLGVKGLIADPQLPFLIHWQTGGELHPSASGPSEARLSGL